MKTLWPRLAIGSLLPVLGAFAADADVPAGYTGRPYNGAPAPIPGKIEAEAYDLAPGAKPDIAFHYAGDTHTTPFRTQAYDSVGLAQYGEGHVSIQGKAEAPDQVYVGWTQEGEWLRYTIHVKEPGTYIIGGKFSAGSTGAKVSFTFSPGLTTGPVEIPTTAGYQPATEVYHVWETLDHLAEIKLPAGTFVMTFKIEAVANINIDYFTFTRKS